MHGIPGKVYSMPFLGKIAIKCLNDYCKQKKSNKDPIFNPKELNIKGATYWDEINLGESKNINK